MRFSGGLTRIGALAGTATLALGLAAAPAFAATKAPSAAVSPNTGIKAGTVIKVSGKHWVTGDTIVAVECNANILTKDASACDDSTASFLANTAGKVSGTLTAVAGTVGDGTCGAKATCYIAVLDYTQYASNPATADEAVAKIVMSKKA